MFVAFILKIYVLPREVYEYALISWFPSLHALCTDGSLTICYATNVMLLYLDKEMVEGKYICMKLSSPTQQHHGHCYVIKTTVSSST